MIKTHVPNCDDCGHPASDHTVEEGCNHCTCPSLLVIADHEAEAHLARMAHYDHWARKLSTRWARRTRRHFTTVVAR